MRDEIQELLETKAEHGEYIEVDEDSGENRFDTTIKAGKVLHRLKELH